MTDGWSDGWTLPSRFSACFATLAVDDKGPGTPEPKATLRNVGQ